MIQRTSIPRLTSLVSVFVLAIGIIAPIKARALTGSDFRSGRIIDDAVFFNPGSMSADQIQSFLDAKVPVCDTNGTQARGNTTRAAYGTSAGYPPPYTCIKNYSENVSSRSADSYCSNGISGGTKTAAQIIYEVAQACGVSPKALIVTLQKEQSLITDDWPWSIQYRSAMGYGCPDTAACDSQYYGFFNQVYSAARQFQRYAKQSNIFNYSAGRTGYVQYNPNAGCGGGNVYIETSATAGLYNYTPYQPNGAALNNLYGTGDDCSAYGNRNFWRMFIDWFGSTTTNTPFAWDYEGQEVYSDAAMTQPFTSFTTVAPGAKIYARVRARNIGTQTWLQNVRLGTSHPNDRSSSFYDSSWLGSSRPAKLKETSITPGQTGTFEFVLKAPNTTGTYKEYFNVLVEGATWMNIPGLYFSINVVQPIPPLTSNNNILEPGEELLPGNYLLSQDKQSTLNLQQDGNLVLYQNFRPVWNTGTSGTSPRKVVMQTDGNMVLYSTSGQALWNSGTNASPNASAVLQTDGNIVVYDTSTVAKWNSGTPHNPNLLGYINDTLNPAKLYPGQQLETPDRKYRLVLQTDGNIVLYSPNRALWNSSTAGKTPGYLSMQGDGNLVLYSTSGQALWNSGTGRAGASRLVLQMDGNLVTYDGLNRPTWNTRTAGQL